jgi:chromosome partitioning protein
MLKIAVAHQKGGVGKSLLTKSMAMEAPKSSVVTDTDPQGSTRYWIDKRRGKGVKNPAAAFCPVEKLPAIMKQAEDRGYKYFYVDTPPDHADERNIKAALEACDCLVIPTKMSDEDLRVLPKTIAMANDLGKPWVIVLNMGKRSRALMRAVKIIQSMCEKLGGTFCPTIVYDRMEHVDGVHLHMVAKEISEKSKAAAEIKAMTRFIIKTMKKEVEDAKAQKTDS